MTVFDVMFAVSIGMVIGLLMAVAAVAIMERMER